MLNPYESPGQPSEFDEIRMQVANSADALVKLVLTLATIAAENAARARRQRWEQEQQAAAERQWRERAAAEPWLRAPYDERFWDNLEPTPEGMRPLGQAWQTAYEWGGSDPQAAAALHHMRFKIYEKFGVFVPDDMLPVQDLSRAIALSDPNLQAQAEAGREAAAESGQTSYLYVIEDPSSDTQMATGEVRGHDWESPDLVAAHAHEQWAAGTGGTALGDNVVVRVYENTGGPVGGQQPLAVVHAQRVPELLEAEEERQRRVIAGTDEASPQEFLHAIDAEHKRAGERAERLQEARDRLADAGPAGVPDGDHDRQVEAFQKEALHERMNQAHLYLHGQAYEAMMRGEDPDLVYASAAVRSRLDQGWMADATPAEAAGLWNEINGWEHGAARDQALDAVNGQLVNHFGTELNGDISRGDAVAMLQDGAAAKAEAEPDQVRQDALELHRRALEKNNVALLNEDEVARIRAGAPPKTPEAADLQDAKIANLESGARNLRASADIDTRAAGDVEAHADRLAASDPSDPSALPPGVTKEQVETAYQSAWGEELRGETAPPAPSEAPSAQAAPPTPDASAPTPIPAAAPAPAAAPVPPAPASASAARARQTSARVRRGPSEKVLKANARRNQPNRGAAAIGPASLEYGRGGQRIDAAVRQKPSAQATGQSAAQPGHSRKVSGPNLEK